MSTLRTDAIVKNAWRQGLAVPGFNIPYLPMMAPVVQALRDCDSFGLVMVARLEWVKFSSGSLRAIRDEYEKVKDLGHTRLHLDHVPVIDEDNLRVDYAAVISEAMALGYESVMVDGSRLPLAENIACTAKVAALAKDYGVPVEAELGAVMGHEAGPLPPYEELFASKKGFTDADEARRFVAESGTDWLSVAIGNIHGAISAAGKQKEKPRARLDIDHLALLQKATGIPLVLHGGTGIAAEYVQQAIKRGIAKINVATAIRQPYERTLAQGGDTAAAQQAVYDAMLTIIRDELHIDGSAPQLLGTGLGRGE
ncbi:MAG: class II fructose-bisphosphate aldolase [Lentisphaerae bacterium]|nr:class II fructose-bisphosphate aldolase [Lentisphaerota bacterium]